MVFDVAGMRKTKICPCSGVTHHHIDIDDFWDYCPKCGGDLLEVESVETKEGTPLDEAMRIYDEAKRANKGLAMGKDKW